MTQSVLVLHHGLDVLLIGRSHRRRPHRRRRDPELTDVRYLLHAVLLHTGQEQRLRVAARSWGADPHMLRNRVSLHDALIQMIEAGRIDARPVRVHLADLKASDIVRALPPDGRLPPLPNDFGSVDLPRRWAALFQAIEKRLGPELGLRWARLFNESLKARMIAIGRERAQRQPEATASALLPSRVPPQEFGTFGEELDVVDYCTHRLNRVRHVSQIEDLAEALTRLIKTLGLEPFVRAMRRLRVRRPPWVATSDAPPARPSAPPPRDLPPPPPPKSETDFPDEAAQAATLKKAAEDGTPFCEICGR